MSTNFFIHYDQNLEQPSVFQIGEVDVVYSYNGTVLSDKKETWY